MQTMLTRLRDERGMGLIELVAAMVVITIALLALMASYDQAFFSLHAAARKTAGTTEVTNASCTTTDAQCMPVQASVKGSDGKNYRIETFIRDISQTLTCQGQTTTCGTTTERDVTVIVRDPNVSGTPVVYQATAAFDSGPR